MNTLDFLERAGLVRGTVWSGLLLCVSLGGPVSMADNGSIARAYPQADVTIDGDLSDWPADGTRYRIAHPHHGPVLADSVAAPTARIGYHLGSRSLLLAVEVDDEHHHVNVADSVGWLQRDTVALYLDPTHSPRGSGPAAYLASGARREIGGVSGAWDPAPSQASWDDVDLAVKRHGTKTVWEWRVRLGDRLQPGRSLGFDLLVADKDGDEPGTFLTWGENHAIVQAAYKAGDLLLVDPERPTGTVRGRVIWRDDIRPIPWNGSVVHVESADRSATRPGSLSLHVEADEAGRFEIELPAGEYRFAPSLLVFGAEKFRVEDDLSVAATVRAGRTIDAAPLRYDTFLDPPAIGRETGALFSFDEKSAKQLDAFIERTMAHFDIAGSSVALVKDGRIAYHRTFGVKNGYTGEPVNPHTLFEAASLTKTIFAFTVNRLAERGVIDLDRPLHEILVFPAIAHDERYRTITARHVLTHQTGLPNWGRGQMSIEFDPGSGYSYSGEGFEYLGRVLSHITGEPLEDVVRRETLDALGLSDVDFHFSANDDLERRTAHGHDSKRPFRQTLPTRIGVAHSMFTESRSFARFMLALMERRGLSPAGYEAMLSSWTQIPDEDADSKHLDWPQSFGLGFYLKQSPFGKVYGHSGSNGDFKCLYEIYDEAGVGFVVFTNSSAGDAFYDHLRRYLIEGAPQASKG